MKIGVLALIVACVTGLDQLSKQWALSALADGHRIDVLGSWLSLRLVFNSGAAFSLGSQMTWVLSLVALGVVVVIVLQARKLGSWMWTAALGLLLGGAIGNLIDRFFRAPGPGRGHVVDFIAYGNWFVGNVADIAIVAAAVLIVILSFLGISPSGQRHAGREAAASVVANDADPSVAAAADGRSDDNDHD